MVLYCLSCLFVGSTYLAADAYDVVEGSRVGLHLPHALLTCEVR